ncbi:MAG: hypothetical protein PUB18_01375 [bacterium]|nr:hypothetical protein [bacterium]
MPSWKIHSKIANDLYKQLKINKKYFMIGNLLPDQDKYSIPNIDKSVNRTITHFISSEDLKVGINLPDYNRMYEKYKDHFNNPVLLGYLVHLLTDFYWNDYIYNKYFIKNNEEYIGVKINNGNIVNCEFSVANSMKQSDFRKFNNLLSVRKNHFRFCLNNNFFREITELKLSKKDIYSVGKYLNLSHLKTKDNTEYKILNEIELNKLLENSKKFILKYLKDKKIIN